MKWADIRRKGLSLLRYLGIRALLILALVSPILTAVSVMLCGRYERARGSIVPRYLRDDEELMRKHLYTMAPSLEFMADRYGALEFEDPARFSKSDNVLAPLARHVQVNRLTVKGHMPATRDLNDYKNSLNAAELIVSARAADDLFSVFLEKKYAAKGEELLTAIRSRNDVPDWLIDAFPDERRRASVLDSLELISLAIMNNELNSSYVGYDEVARPPDAFIREPRWLPISTPEWDVWSDFVRGLPGQYKWLVTKEVYWRTFLRRRYGGDIAELNKAWGSNFAGFCEVPWGKEPETVAAGGADWREFVYRGWPRHMLKLPPGYDSQWRAFLAERFSGNDGMFGIALGGAEGGEIKLPLTRPDFSAIDSLWCDFVESEIVPHEEIQLLTHSERFGPFLRSNYLGGRIISLNEEWVTAFEGFADVPLPLGLSDLSLFPSGPDELRRAYATESWFSVLTSLRYPGGVVRRTLDASVLMVLISLTLSVVVAYLLARLPVRFGPRAIAWAVTASVIPAASWLAAGGATVEGVLGPWRVPTLAVCGVTLLSCVFLRRWFFDIVRNYREPACMDGVGEVGFIVRFVLPYSWQVIVYAAVIHFLCIYPAVDWQVLAMGRLWNWTLAAWALDHGLSEPSVTVAVALLGMLPLFFAVAVCYPLLTRYSLVPKFRAGQGDDAS